MKRLNQLCILELAEESTKPIVSGGTKGTLGLTVHFYPVQEMKKQNQNWPAMSSK